MKKNNFMLLVVFTVVIIAGLGLGLILTNKGGEADKSSGENDVQAPLVSDNNAAQYPTATPITLEGKVVPTSDPGIRYPSTVYEKTDEYIAFTQPGGSGKWPKNIKLNVFKVVDGNNVPGTWDDIKVGQNARITIKTPGQEGSIYLSE